MEFGKSTTNFDSPPAESCPHGRRNAEPVLPAEGQRRRGVRPLLGAGRPSVAPGVKLHHL